MIKFPEKDSESNAYGVVYNQCREDFIHMLKNLVSDNSFTQDGVLMHLKYLLEQEQ